MALRGVIYGVSHDSYFHIIIVIEPEAMPLEALPCKQVDSSPNTQFLIKQQNWSIKTLGDYGLTNKVYTA